MTGARQAITVIITFRKSNKNSLQRRSRAYLSSKKINACIYHTTLPYTFMMCCLHITFTFTCAACIFCADVQLKVDSILKKLPPVPNFTKI
jgi:hypothetical protein